MKTGGGENGFLQPFPALRAGFPDWKAPRAHPFAPDPHPTGETADARYAATAVSVSVSP
jgi:hypothetical protein